MFFVAISVIFIFGGNEADKGGFVPRIQYGLSRVREGGTQRTPAAEGGKRRPRPMSTVPEADDDRQAADGVWEG